MKRLYRSRTNAMLAGVAGGLGEYMALDPTVIRLLLAFLTVASCGTGLLFYIVAAIVIPPEPRG